jgi:catechol 2,3-dioxygenase-like lactoylglutathione lyase family enzyme
MRIESREHPALNTEGSKAIRGVIQETGFHVCIATSDFERSLNFYKALGFTAANQMQVQREGFKMQYLFHEACNATLEIMFHSDRTHVDKLDIARKDILGLNHFGFHVNELDGVRDALKSLGAPIIEDSSRGSYDFIFAKGPDDELISFAKFNEECPVQDQDIMA